MSYLDRAKAVPRRQSSVASAKKANYANKATSTAQTPSEDVRKKGVESPLVYEGLTLTHRTTTLERLPEPLERLIAAASSDLLTKEPVALADGLTYHLSSYVLAWAASYLTGDPDEALRRLWNAHRAWDGVN